MAKDNILSPLPSHSEISNKEAISLDQKWVISNAMYIIELLVRLKYNPEKFPVKKDMVYYSDTFKIKAISKQEILRWHICSSQSIQGWKMTEQSFDEIIKLCVYIGKLKIKQDAEICYYYWSA